MNSMNTLEAWSYFSAIFQETVDKFVPLSRSGNKKSTYMSAEAFQLRKLKHKLRKKHCLSKANCDYSTFVTDLEVLPCI